MPGDIVNTDRSIIVLKASWCCIVLLGQLAQSTHFTLLCPMSWMLSGYSFAFILVELRNKWILTFWIIICPFSTQKCQCSASNFASVVKRYRFGTLLCVEDLDILTAYFVSDLCMAIVCHYLELFTMYLDFLSGSILQVKSNNVHGFMENVFSGCVSRGCIFKMSCSFISVTMVAIHEGA